MLSPTELAEVRDEAVRIAIDAGAVLRAGLHRDIRTEHKSALDLVTSVDRESETLITERLARAFPDHAILGEEGGFTEGRNRTNGRWIIDPLDGTTNFVHGLEHFAVSIGFEWRGEVVVGVVYDPCRDELFEAIKEQGSRVNGRSLRVSACSDLETALLVTGFPYDRRGHVSFYLHHVANFLSRCQGLRRLGAAALDFAYIAAGRLDGYWEFRLKPWDAAAGMLLVREATGVVREPGGGEAVLGSTGFVAANSVLADKMVYVMRDLADPP